MKWTHEPDPYGSGRPMAAGSAVWVIAGAGVSGISTYAVQVVVGRAVGLQPFADFSVFWSAALIAALGFFLPLEQETARRVAGLGASPAGRLMIWRRACTAAGGVVALAVVVGATGWLFTTASPAILIAFAVACAGYGLQFPARGVLAGQRHLAAYSAVVAADSLLRLGASVGLLLLGVHSAGVYALVVAASAVVAGLMATVLARVWGRPAKGPAVSGLVRNTAGLVLAASCMQLLLNSGTLVARTLAGPAQQVVAAHLISFMTLARLPVFVFQALQAVYVARLATGAHRADFEAVKQLIRRLGLLALSMGTATVAGSALFGPWAIRIFGPTFQVNTGSAAMIGLSVAVYLVASVGNDVSVALGLHKRVVSTWPVAVVVALIAALTIQDLVTRSTIPLMAATALAAALLVRGLYIRLNKENEKAHA